jgi:DNA-binding NarL/FixJ family response regulator
MRILFVDDEPLILEGLQNLLRRFRKKWKMSFAAGGDEALEWLQKDSFDIVVTDMRMPGLSGADILQRVRDHHPGTARIMLSGYSEEETILQALPVAHQYMSKPCDPVILQRIIENLVAGIEELEHPKLAQASSQLGAPLTPPQTLETLQTLLEDAEHNSDAIHRLVASDIGLTARLIQIVSSSFFGRPQAVNDVGQAIHYLGLPMLNKLVHQVGIFNTHVPGDAAGQEKFLNLQKDVQRFSQHVAVLLGEGPEGGPATTGSMLVALSSLALIQMGDIVESTPKIENRLNQFILRLWGLPEKLVNLSRWLDNRPDGSTLEVPHAIYAARHVWLMRGSQEAGLDVDFLKSLGLASEIEAWTSQVQSRIERD